MAFAADEAFDLLARAHAAGRLGHAYILAGPEGAGGRELALRLTAMLVDAKGDPLKHPDVRAVEPEKRARRITVDQARDVEQQLYKTASVRGGRKVAIFFAADRLNEAAANAFLKTLEEPPPGTHIFLVTEQPEQLLETILSRCIEVPLRPLQVRSLTARERQLVDHLTTFAKHPTPDLAQAFSLAREFQTLLAQAKEEITTESEARLKAEVKGFRDATDVDGAWVEEREDYYKALTEARYRETRGRLIATLERWWADVLRQQAGATNLDLPEAAATTASLATRLPIAQVLRRVDAIAKLRQHFDTNVQEQLAIEVAFLDAFAA